MVKYVLFGENVSESLRNCMVYDTELQPIELVGQFGVYSRGGWQMDTDPRYVRGENFYISTLPEIVQSEPVTEGFPFLAGELVLKQTVILDTSHVCLKLAGDYQTASVKVNGKEAGKLLFDTELAISDFAKRGENEIEVSFLLNNKNLMGPHHLVGEKDRYTAPSCFQLFGQWTGKESEQYHAYYDIKKFYA